MSDAPERIWANFRNWRNPHEGHCYKHDDLGGSEYVRADIVDALVAEKEREALTEAAYIARNACLVPPDGGNPTEYERLVCEEASRRILALRDQKEPKG